jgi:hypothetical protein
MTHIGADNFRTRRRQQKGRAMNGGIVNVLSLCVVAGLAGCLQHGGTDAKPTVTINTPITEAELAPYKKPGRATVTGRAFLRKQGGGVVSCAGQRVLLTPAVAFNRDVVAARLGGERPVPGPNVGSTRPYWKTQTCDAQGRFRFTQVQAADWFISIPVRWKDQEEGAVMKLIKVPRAGTLEVQLSDRDAIR